MRYYDYNMTNEYRESTSIKEKILDLLFPVFCIFCDHKTKPYLTQNQTIPQYICASCLNDIHKINNNHCLFCKAPSLHGITCPFCKSSHFVDQIISSVAYSDKKVQQIIKTLKYRFVDSVAYTISKRIAETLKKHEIGQNAIITEVPL